MNEEELLEVADDFYQLTNSFENIVSDLEQNNPILAYRTAFKAIHFAGECRRKYYRQTEEWKKKAFPPEQTT